MDLQDHAGGKALGFQATSHARHGDFDDVGSATLHGVVHGRALAEAALHGVLRLELRDGAAATVHGLGIARRLGLVHRAVQIGAHPRIRLEVGVDHLARLGHGDLERLREAVRLLAVHDAEVHGLRAAAKLGRHLVDRHAEHARGGLGMEVLALVEGRHQMRVAGEVREQAQLDLAVVHREEDLALTGGEGGLHRVPQLRAGGDVLQVGVRGGQAPRGGDGLVVRGVHPPVARAERTERV